MPPLALPLLLLSLFSSPSTCTTAEPWSIATAVTEGCAEACDGHPRTSEAECDTLCAIGPHLLTHQSSSHSLSVVEQELKITENRNSAVLWSLQDVLSSAIRVPGRETHELAVEFSDRLEYYTHLLSKQERDEL